MTVRSIKDRDNPFVSGYWNMPMDSQERQTWNDEGGHVIRDDATFLSQQILVWETWHS